VFGKIVTALLRTCVFDTWDTRESELPAHISIFRFQEIEYIDRFVQIVKLKVIKVCGNGLHQACKFWWKKWMMSVAEAHS
jgi:hypothetical protein